MKDETDTESISPTKTDGGPDVRSRKTGSNAASELSNIVSGGKYKSHHSSPKLTPIPVDKSTNPESGSKDFADRIAALSNNWMSIKHTDLAPIKEYVPGDDKSNTAQQKDKKPEPIPARKRPVVKEPSQRSKPVIAKKEPTPVAKTSRNTAVSSKGSKFDLAKTMDELDQIKKKVDNSSSLHQTSKKNTEGGNLGHSVNKKSVDHQFEDGEETTSQQGEETSRKEGGKVSSLAARRAQLNSKKSSGETQSGNTKRGNLVKYKKMMEEIEMNFSQSIKKVQEFQRETGSHLRMHEFNKEYQKLIDSIKEVVKKAS